MCTKYASLDFRSWYWKLESLTLTFKAICPFWLRIPRRIWLELNEGDKRCCLISCIYRPPSSSQAYYSKVVDIYERALPDDIPIISMGDLNYDYKLDEYLSNNPIHYIAMAYEMTQLILQPTRVTSDTSTTLDMILVYHPGLHKSSGVMKYNFSDHYLV